MTPLPHAQPLPLLAALHPHAHQTLDREKGQVQVRFPAGAEHDAIRITGTTLRVPAISDSKDVVQRMAQDDALATLDRFCATRFQEDFSLWSLHPPAITLDATGREIRVGDLPVATLTQERWLLDENAASHVSEVLGTAFSDPVRPVHEWAGAPVDLALSTYQPGHRDLRLLLQLEDDPTILKNVASRQLAHPDESVWIQVDTMHRHWIVAGDELLDALPADARIKVEVHGHGGRIGMSDERCLAGRSATEIASVLSGTMDRLGLHQPIDAVDLTSCALATRAFPRSFAGDVLKAGHRLSLFRPTTEVTAYTDNMSFRLHPDSLRQIGARVSLFTESSTPEARAPGKSLAFSLERGTGKLIVRDKHPEVGPDRPAARPATRSPEAYPAEDATDLPTVSPWAVRGPGMAI